MSVFVERNIDPYHLYMRLDYDRDINSLADTGMAELIGGTFRWTLATTVPGFTLSGPVVATFVPEPATWAMMLGGFGIIGAAMRRWNVSVAFA